MKTLKSSKSTGFVKKSCNKSQFLRPNGVEIVPNMSQSFQNFIINVEKQLFDLSKSHKDNLKKIVDPPFYQ